MKKTLIILAAVAMVGCSGGEKIYSLYPGDTRMWEHIFEVEELHDFESVPLGAIIPHHMVVDVEIAKFYASIEAVIEPSVVVVIGPNHYENGEANIQTCRDCVYDTVNGDVEVGRELVDKLLDEKVAERLDETFIKEHSIFSHTPFIKKYFPEVQIVPILLQWEMPVEEVSRLAEWLDDNLPEDALVIASVDFSHYISAEAADFHDQSAFATISNFDFANLYDLEVDSPSSLYALLDLMKRRGYMKAERFAHTNLQDFLTARVEETTSHQFFGFFKGEGEKVQGVSIMTVEDYDNNLGLVDNWDWEKENNRGLLRDLRGAEDRFLTGSDFLVFDLDEGCSLKEQNGWKISFCKNVFLDQGSDVNYLLYEFEDDFDLARAKRFIDEGVDVFVGRGFVLGGGEDFIEYGDGLILSGDEKVLGVYVREDSFDIYQFIVKKVGAYPMIQEVKDVVKIER